jgi:hypothetical protein
MALAKIEDEGCDVFMNENEMRMDKIIGGERFEEIPNLYHHFLIMCTKKIL